MIVGVVSLSILLCSQDNAVFSVIRSSLGSSTVATHICCVTANQFEIQNLTLAIFSVKPFVRGLTCLGYRGRMVLLKI